MVGNMLRKIIRKLIRFMCKDEIKQMNYAVGLNSHIDIEKDKHMLFLDYDNNDFNFVLKDVRELVDFWKLSDYEIYKTRNGYHVFFWYNNDIPYSRLKMIIDFSRCDVMFKYIRKNFNYATLRASGKYVDNDIEWVGKFMGLRKPLSTQRDLGNLKKQEYNELKKQKIFKDEVLKE